MMTPRETWTDQRLDELKSDMDHRFDKVDQRFDAVDQRFNAVEGRMVEGFTRLDGDIRELRRMMFQGFIALVGLMVTGFLTLVGLMVF